VTHTYFFYCIDKPDSAALREQFLTEHLSYIEKILDHLEVAGPLRDEGSEEIIGSCFVFNVDTRRKAEQLLHDDPYYQAGIWRQVTCHRFNPAAGSWVGGTAWNR